MKISTQKPPCYEEANALFKLEELNMGTVFTYGDILYNPSNIAISQDLFVHEEVHAKQHHHNDTVAKLWWQRYIADPKFRAEQEAEAYGAQYAFLCKTTKDRNAQAKILYRMAGWLSGPMYGRPVMHTEAMQMIRAAAKGIQ